MENLTYQEFFDATPCYLTVQDRDFRVIAANRRFREHFGDFAGRHCFEIYKHRTEKCDVCPVEKAFGDGKSHRSEEQVENLQGQGFSVVVYTMPIKDENGEIKAVLELSADITPIRELQSQLENIGLLIGSISHSIKGLLTGLDGGVYMVETGLKKDNRQRLETGWEMVKRNVDRIRDTVMNILYYAKEREPNWEDVSAQSLAQDVVAIAQTRAEKHQITLEHSCDEHVGSFEGDSKAMRSLLINLMENSLDACRVDKKKDQHTVRFGVFGDTDHVRFEIEDNGIGMDRETRKLAFSAFFSSKGAEGTGLGLFVSNNIAKVHGGTIELDSEANRGTRFVVRIPRKRTINSAASGALAARVF